MNLNVWMKFLPIFFVTVGVLSCDSTKTPDDETVQPTQSATLDDVRLQTSPEKNSFRAAGVATATDCPTVPPLGPVFPGINFYTNATEEGDIVDEKLRTDHECAMKPLNEFMLSAGRAIDGTPIWSHIVIKSIPEVMTQLSTWATNATFLSPPTTSAGRVGRVKYTTGLNLIAAKLVSKGHDLPPHVIIWLRNPLALELATLCFPMKVGPDSF
jgi:hypothetical protein